MLLDEVYIAWIFKQSMGESSNFYSEAKTLYRIVSYILAKARVVENLDTWYTIATFL
jgi:hypothetical protein